MTRVRPIAAALLLLGLLLAPGTLVGFLGDLAPAVSSWPRDQVRDRADQAAVPLAVEHELRRAEAPSMAGVMAACGAAALLLLAGSGARRRPAEVQAARLWCHLPARAPPLG